LCAVVTVQIEVYVRKRKQIVRQYVTPPVWDGYQHHACMSKQVTEYEDVLLDPDKEALRIVDQLATEAGLSFKVYDVATFSGKVRAKSKGIAKTPALILNGEKIEAISSEFLRTKIHV
jgi:hypothetical protein